MKHILVISSWYPNEESPFLGNFVQRQVDVLEQIYQVTLIDVQYYEKQESCAILREQEGNKTEYRISIPKKYNSIKRLYHTRRLIKKCFAEIKQVDYIYGNIIFNKGFLFVWAKKYFKVPLVVNDSASYLSTEEIKKWSSSQKRLFRYIEKHSSLFVVVSEVLRRSLSEITNKKIVIIPNGIDEKIFVPQQKLRESNIRFLHISTLDKRYKNPEALLRVFQRLQQEGVNDIVLDIVCDENFSEYLLYVQDHQLTEMVHFHYRVPYNEIPAYYHRADYFILFSNYETFSCVLAESWMSGTPTLTTPVGIALEMSPENGLIFQDEDQLYQFIQEIRHGAHRFSENEVAKNAEMYKNSNLPLLFRSVFQ